MTNKKTKEKNFKNLWSADFETCTWLEDETYVWAWAVCNIETQEILIDNNIDSFMDFCRSQKNPTMYFHNLKFDGEFIIYWLLTHGFEYVDKKERRDNTFSTIISDLGMFYSIEVYFKVGNKSVKKVTFIDSLKIIPLSVEDISKAFGLEESKLELDYDKPRELGHILTEEEKDYISHDVIITAKALKELFNSGLTHMTQASNAMHDYKDIIGLNRFNRLFPKLNFDIDEDIRRAYKGGFTYLNPRWKEVDINGGVVLDVNSLYPSVMYEKPMPFGEGIFYDGKYEDDPVYPLYIECITCAFEIKKDHIPTIQIKGKGRRSIFKQNEYLESSLGEIVTLVLTSVDLKLFLEQYDVYDLKYECGWKFKQMTGVFTEYIDKWINEKIKASKEGNKGKRQIAKLMLNSLYGKFATSLELQSKKPILCEDGRISYEDLDPEIVEGMYIPIGAFITAYAREKTIRTSQAIKTYSIETYGEDLYFYSDTDSIHCGLDIDELKNFCDIDDYRLGAWKHESTFTKARFVRQKCYIEEIDGKMEITCAGMPKSCYKYVEWDKFREGFTCRGKLNFTHVKGGVKLVEETFTIMPERSLKRSLAKW